MDPLSPLELLAYAAGSLDPSHARVVEERLRVDPLLRAELSAARERLAEPPGDGDAGWRVPGSRHPPVRARPAPELGGVERLVVRLEQLPPRPPDRFLVVLSRAEGGPWRVVFPEQPEDLIPLHELPLDEGLPSFELVADPGDQAPEWALILPELADAPPWGEPEGTRWSGLVQRLRRGEVPALRVRS